MAPEMGSDVQEEPSPEPEMGGEDPFGGEDMGGEDMGGEKPFDDEPFDAGVEASEEESPEKYIQQLSGKLGQSLRNYTETMGQPDFDLEKFAINSVLSATNSAEMDQEDQTDIINKVKSSSTDGGGEGAGDEAGVDDAQSDAQSDALNDAPFGNEDEVDVEDEFMGESHNPNPMGQTVFADASLGVEDGGMEENKYLNLENQNKSSIFALNIKDMVRESLRLDSTTTEPITKPTTKPAVKPARRSKPWTIVPEGVPDPNPKAGIDEDDATGIAYLDSTRFSGQDGAEEVVIKFTINGEVKEVLFSNNDTLLEKPEAYDEPWIYQFTSDVVEGKVYGVDVDFEGHPLSNLELLGFSDSIPEIYEVE
jgi:hypothetical protein